MRRGTLNAAFPPLPLGLVRLLRPNCLWRLPNGTAVARQASITMGRLVPWSTPACRPDRRPPPIHALVLMLEVLVVLVVLGRLPRSRPPPSPLVTALADPSPRPPPSIGPRLAPTPRDALVTALVTALVA